MKTANKAKKMVERMREIREEVSLKIMNMSLDEEREYIKQQLDLVKRKRAAR